MLKVLGVRLEDNFIKQVKMLAIQQGIPVQEYVRLALVAYENKDVRADVHEPISEDFFGTFELPAYRVERPEEQIRTIKKEDLDPNDPLEAMMLAQYEKFGD